MPGCPIVARADVLIVGVRQATRWALEDHVDRLVAGADELFESLDQRARSSLAALGARRFASVTIT